MSTQAKVTALARADAARLAADAAAAAQGIPPLTDAQRARTKRMHELAGYGRTRLIAAATSAGVDFQDLDTAALTCDRIIGWVLEREGH